MVQHIVPTRTAPSGAPPTQVNWPGVIAFVVLSYAIAWAVTIPFWLSPRGLALPGSRIILGLLMFAPAIASLLVVRLLERRPWLRAVGLRRGPLLRVIGYSGLALGLILLVMIISVAVSGALGVQQLDLVQLSGVRAAQSRLPGVVATMPPAVFLLLQLVNVVIASITINALAALGEEVGWRGYLLPALLPLGRGAAIGITGVVWGLWHTPLILLGYEYPGASRPAALVLFVIFTVAVGALLAWLRLRSGSVIPGAIAHGTLNAFATVVPLLLIGGRLGHQLLGAPLGVVAIVCFSVAAAVLFAVARPGPVRDRSVGLDR